MTEDDYETRERRDAERRAFVQRRLSEMLSREYKFEDYERDHEDDEGTKELSLIAAIKARLPELKQLRDSANAEWLYEDGIYRFYHGSFKVFVLQDFTERVVELILNWLTGCSTAVFWKSRLPGRAGSSGRRNRKARATFPGILWRHTSTPATSSKCSASMANTPPSWKNRSTGSCRSSPGASGRSHPTRYLREILFPAVGRRCWNCSIYGENHAMAEMRKARRRQITSWNSQFTEYRSLLWPHNPFVSVLRFESPTRRS